MDDRSPLQATIALLEATLESTHDAILVVDLHRRIVRHNRRYLTLFGVTPDELSGGDAVIAGPADQLEDADRAMEASRAIWSDPSREVFDTLRLKDGRVFERFVAPYRIGAEIVGLVASFRDVSRAARAEAALAQLSSEFSSWMDDECERLDRARRNVRQNGMTALPREALYRSAHDIKGQAATLGFPLVAAVAESLCRLIEETHDPADIPLDLVDQHVDAVRAIIREHGHPQADAIAAQLTRTLRQVCEDFIARQQPQPSGAEA